MLWPEALVLLCVDEPLDLPGNPAAVVDLQVLEQALDEAQLVVGVDDLEVLRQAGLTPVTPEHAVGEAVERADPQVSDRHVEQRLDPAPHFGRRLVGEGYGEQAVR